MSRSINFCCWPHQLQWCPGLLFLFPSVFQYLFLLSLCLVECCTSFPFQTGSHCVCFWASFPMWAVQFFLIMPCPFSLFLGDEAFCFFSEICRLYRSFRIPFLWLILLFLLISCSLISIFFLWHSCIVTSLCCFGCMPMTFCFVNIVSSFLLQLFCIQSPSWLFTIHLRSSLYHTLILYCEISIMLSMNFDCLLCMGVLFV